MANNILTTSDIQYLIQSKAWIEISLRIDRELEKADQHMEDKDPYEHGRAVGTRQALRLLKGWPEQLRREIEHPIIRSIK